MTSEGEAIKGRRIDRYELHELIGEGGMGAVYRAVDSRLGRTVALKTVVPQRSGVGLTDELRQRFMREALAASKVEHRNVVQVIDFGVTGDGTPYLVMEYLRGRDLGVLLRKATQPLAIEYVADVMLGVCAALRACHQLGIVHRDLKPSNIFLADTDTGHEIKVLDFGVSKAPMADDLTQEGQILGTPQYLSPEQINGKVGPESDQYALGVLLYVCLTKRLPFEEHQNLSLLRAIEVGRFPGPRAHRSDIPVALEAIILRAMHTNPAERFESVHVLGQRLWEFASSRGQVEWKNYYFHSPPVAMPAKATLRGVPLAPGEPEGVATAPGDLAPTAVLAPGPGSTSPLPESGSPDDAKQRALPSPQLFISTKLARPLARDAEKIGGEPSQAVAENEDSDPGARRRRGRFIAAIFLVLVGGGGGFAYLRTRNSPPGPSPISNPSSPVFSPAPAVPAPEVARPISTAPPFSTSKPPAATPPRPVSHPVAETPVSVSTRSAGPEPGRKPLAKVQVKSPPQEQSPAGPSSPASPGHSIADRKKHATSEAKSSKMSLDQNGIGIPAN